VRLCAQTLEVEQIPESLPKADHPEVERARPEVTKSVDWSSFRFDSLDLEWSASRHVSHSLRRLNVVTVRDPSGATSMLQLFPHVPTTADVMCALEIDKHMVERSKLPPPQRYSGGDANGLQWSSDEAAFVEAKPELMVSVRRKGDDHAIGVALAGDWRRTPTVKDAEVAAQVAWSSLTSKR
jgi:hypothetical protein